jgi:hypothetical protein
LPIWHWVPPRMPPRFSFNTNFKNQVWMHLLMFLSLPIWLGTKVFISQPKRGFHFPWLEWSHSAHIHTHTKTLIFWVLSFCLGPILFLRIPHYIYIYLFIYSLFLYSWIVQNILYVPSQKKLIKKNQHLKKEYN